MLQVGATGIEEEEEEEEEVMSTVMSLLPLLGSGFQRRTFPFHRVPELSPASTTNF
jgi:hypothetical protein